MDALLAKVTSQAMNYAIRSGITITASYAIRQCGRLLKEAPRSKERSELMLLQARLDAKIKIISPSIDMIELISARGNTTLDSAVLLTKQIRHDIQQLGKRLNDVANDEVMLKKLNRRTEKNEQELRDIIVAINQLLVRIDDAVPLVNLAITTSGVNLSTNLSGSISPSRLLQASTFLTAADGDYRTTPGRRCQVGPTYTLSVYMLFAGHLRTEESTRPTTWKEVMHKAQAKLVRVPLDRVYNPPGEGGCGTTHAGEFAYQLTLIEDFDDGRVHTVEGEPPGPCEDVSSAGIRDSIPVHQVSKIFYADTGKILNLGSDSDTSSPVLLLKRDIRAQPPWESLLESEMGDEDVPGSGSTSRNGSGNGRVAPALDNVWRLPADLDPEWIALEVFTDQEDSDDEDIADATSRLSVSSSCQSAPAPWPRIKTSLSLLEMLMKLASLQQLRQESHLAIEDELLNFFLEDSSTAGAVYGREQRRRIRHDAERRVGFDPYDESPIKRRGEEYIHQHGAVTPLMLPHTKLQASSMASSSPMASSPGSPKPATSGSPMPATPTSQLLATPASQPSKGSKGSKSA
ncbi:Ran-binding-domain-containing protein [Piedraia hortae CBS 480.64]|uniref:Ran-binding-domain-containing protein n=1 Tax=Piedraia hortae CBS 480.64 TaxID=1314780 RepID=A0A6A7BW20_9PEZI|nr:Ran-binding-domain-containing protein [Piedraia hortae CBS 480.64]